ncbi:MAG: fibronectin type III domain-containing protein, partial [Cyclobacteriaceae bacterium]
MLNNNFKNPVLSLFIAILILSGCGNQGGEREIIFVHKPDSTYIAFPGLFPTPVPDRIIANLAEDPTTSIAVNWRTDTTIFNSTVEVAAATHGPEFIHNTRSIEAETEKLVHKPENDPEVAAHYHSALIDGLESGKKYVYRVGSKRGWSEWFQIKMPEPDKKISFIYFGDAQNDVKSMWSRVIRKAYGELPD